jgi:hypothetical protein
MIYLQSLCLAILAGSILGSVSWRRCLALTLIGALAVMMITPVPANAQAGAGLLGAIQAVLNVINRVIQPILNGINGIRSGIQAFYQQTLWPQNLIATVQRWFMTMSATLYNPFENDFLLPIHSATLPTPQSFEQALLSRTATGMGQLGSLYTQVYGPLPPPRQVSPSLQMRMDVDDAIAQDSMKQALAYDQAQSNNDQAATALEAAGPDQAPGSAPFNTAVGACAQLRSSLIQLRIVSAMLRQESAKLAEENVYRKESTRQSQRLQHEVTGFCHEESKHDAKAIREANLALDPRPHVASRLRDRGDGIVLSEAGAEPVVFAVLRNSGHRSRNDQLDDEQRNWRRLVFHSENRTGHLGVRTNHRLAPGCDTERKESDCFPDWHLSKPEESV